MHLSFWKTIRVVLSLAFLLGLRTGEAKALDYRVDSLPIPPSFPSQAFGINASGQIVGIGTSGGAEVALFWASKTTDSPTPLPFRGYEQGTQALAISDGSQIVGYGYSLGSRVPLFWASPSSAPTELRRGRFNFVEARGINSAGQIVGYSATTFIDGPIIWQSPTATPKRLSSGTFSNTQAFGINDAGQIVGYGLDLASNPVALIWQNPTAEPTPLPSGNVSFFGAGLGINDAGQIIGGSMIWESPTADPTFIAGGSTHNVAYGINDLGQLVGVLQEEPVPAFWESPRTQPSGLPIFKFAHPSGINDAGQIVGWGATQSRGPVALFWASTASIPTFLPSGGFFAPTPRDINNAGQIVGNGFSSSTGTIALFWASPTATPIPLLNGGFTFLTDANGINDAGQIVGLGSVGTGGFPLFWVSPTASPIVLGNGQQIEPTDINNSGQIVGILEFNPFISMYWENPSASPPTVLASGILSYGINDLGQIVGRLVDPLLGLTAAVQASPTDLPISLPGGNLIALGINNNGQIVGMNQTLWTPLGSPLPLPLFLHAQGSGLVLDSNVPTDATADFRDSRSLKFDGGNTWKTLGTWSYLETESRRTLAGLGDLRVWLAVTNNDDQGTRFDVRAEILKNGEPVASGEAYCIKGLKDSAKKALEAFVPFAIEDPDFGPDDQLSLRVLARIGTKENGAFCGGNKKAAALRLYFDAVNRPTQLRALP